MVQLALVVADLARQLGAQLEDFLLLEVGRLLCRLSLLPSPVSALTDFEACLVEPLLGFLQSRLERLFRCPLLLLLLPH